MQSYRRENRVRVDIKPTIRKRSKEKIIPMITMGRTQSDRYRRGEWSNEEDEKRERRSRGEGAIDHVTIGSTESKCGTSYIANPAGYGLLGLLSQWLYLLDPTLFIRTLLSVNTYYILVMYIFWLSGKVGLTNEYITLSV